ncbi:MAG: RsmE family RNA methyltransferase, partial [Maribacter sp.]
MQLFYSPELTASSENFTFDSEESKHIVKVLRGKIGDQLHITNGKGLFFVARITESNPKICTVEFVDFKKDHPKKYWLHMAVAPTKMNDRYEWFLEKATEIGIHEITPIICNNSERKVVKLERYKKVVQAAMKQSFQSYLPVLN